MAGKPGRSGGARPGAGRPKKQAVPLLPDTGPDLTRQYDDPVAFLEAVMNNTAVDGKLRIDAAKALLPYKHRKVAEQGKKGQQGDAAKAASGGKFAPSAPPALRAVK